MNKQSIAYVSVIGVGLLLVGTLYAAPAPQATQTKIVNKVIATVDGESILLSDYNKVADPIIEAYTKENPDLAGSAKLGELKKEILQQMIDEKLILKAAKKKSIQIPKVKVDQGVRDIKSRFPSEQAFDEEMKKQKMTLDAFRKKVEEQLMMMQVVDAEVRQKVVAPTDEQAKKYYDENKDKMVEPEMVRARHILIKVDAKADETSRAKALQTIQDIKKKIDAGEDFAELAKKFSEDPGSAKKGGDLGPFPRGVMVKEFEDTAFNLNVGKVSDIVKTDYGYHIIRCEERKVEQKKSFDEVKEYIKEFLFRKEMEEKYTAWIDGIRKKAKITINEM